MDYGGPGDNDVQSCLIGVDQMTAGMPLRPSLDEACSVRLTVEENEEMREFLDSATRLSMNKFDLRDGFYTETQPAASWHCLSDDEITAHHRMGVFPHTWQPLSTLDPSTDRHRSAHRTLPKGFDMTARPTEPADSEISGPFVRASSKIPVPLIDKLQTCSISLSESTLPVSNVLSEDPYLLGATNDRAAKKNAATSLDIDTLHYGDTPSEIKDSARALPSAIIYKNEQVSDEDLLLVKSEGDVSLPLLVKHRPIMETQDFEASQPRVSFILGADPDDLDVPDPPKFSQISERNNHSARHSKARRSHSHGRQRHLHGPVLQLSNRRRLGSEVCFGDALKQIPTEIEEALTLDDIHLHGIASHRFDDSKGIRRRKISHHAASVVHISPVKKVRTAPVLPRNQAADIQLHQRKMFVELDELRVGDNQEWAWHEKARWIKFEEDVEEDAQRWGKPHVSSLSFHSLLELRRCIESAAILLDLDASDLPSIATSVVDQLVCLDQLDRGVQDRVLKALLLKHRHLAEERNILRRNITQPLSHFDPCSQSHNASSHFKDASDLSSNILSKVTSAPNTPNATHDLDRQSKDKSSTDEVKHRQNICMQTSHVKFKENNIDLKIRSNPSVRSLLSVLSPKPADSPATGIRHVESHILRRIPGGAEATNVLVGAVDFLDRPVMAFVRLLNASHLENLTEVPLPVRFIFVLMGPENSSFDYHEIGRSLSTLMADPSFHDIAYEAESRQDLLDALNAFLHDSIVLPPGEWDKKTLLPIMEKTQHNVLKKRRKESQKTALEKPDDPLKRTGRLFGGLINDIKRRYPLYLSDLKDGLNLQCVATFFFVYFACLSPAITFGGLLGDKTEKWMGVSEMLVSTAICGIIFSLFSGQPLIIIGATGPVLVFEEALFKVCNSFAVDFLSFRLWVSLWIAAIAVIVVMVEGSFLVQYITRFTEEIFASLISLIFVYEVFKKLILIFQKNPLQRYYPHPLPVNPCAEATDFNKTSNASFSDVNAIPIYNSVNSVEISTYNFSQQSNFSSNCDDLSVDSQGHPNTALLSLILTFGTFLMAHYLKNFRNSQFLGRSARRAIGDFGVPITIIVMVLVDYLIPETFIEKLDVPDGIQPTAPYKRSWIINPVGVTSSLPVWMMLVAIIPALLVFILLFMEAQITSMIVNKKDRKLKKGSGYHLDLFLIGILSSVSGFLGVPFMCSATVRSVTHVSALSVFSRTHAPGEKPQLLQVKEQRLTSLAVHVMIGVSVLLGPVLRQVPLPVLFGIFLYMGIASMSGIQMLTRVRLMFMPVKHHPDVGYARHVRLAKMNLYTLIQLSCLGVLWAVKSTQAALAFPFVLILMVPVRLHIIRFLFSQQELQELDRSEECESDEEEDEPDFYKQAHMPI